MTALILNSLSRSLGLSPRGRSLEGAAPAIVAGSLIAEWRFDQGGGQTLIDYSGNGHHGQLGSTAGADVNDPAWQSAPARLDFDGGNDCVLVNQTHLADLSAYGICAVVRGVAAASDGFYGEGISSNSGPTLLLRNESGQLTWFYRNAAGTGGSWATGLTGLASGDHFVAVVRDGSALRAVLDGGEASSTTSVAVVGGFDASSIGAALRGGSVSVPWEGRIYWMARYTGGLSFAQIQQNRVYAQALMAQRGITLP
jgi:hypothetical protein